MSDKTVSETDVVARVRQAGAIVILRLREHTHAVALGRLLLDAGLPVMEVTFDHPSAPAALRSMADQLPGGVLLGAGTIRTVEQISQCKQAGGRFCVSPHTDPASSAHALMRVLSQFRALTPPPTSKRRSMPVPA